jgi:lysophospholipase L1-like esterase
MRPSRILIIGILALTTALATQVTGGGTPAKAASTVNYVALGDSYASGVGAGNYYSSSGSCDRSPNAYPALWAAADSPSSFTFAACSGAKTTDVVKSQLSALSASTTLVSVTAGGDDAGFSSIMETCVLESTSSCLSAVSQGEAFVNNQLPALLNTMLADIRADAPSARIVLVGYPELYDLSVPICIGLSSADHTALDQAADDLDNALANAAAQNGDVFADVRSQFAGHELCDGAGWLNSVDIFDISSSYHPTATGQEDGYFPVFTAAA